MTERPAARWALVVLGALVALHLAALVLLVGLQRSHADAVLPGVEVDGADVGGLGRDRLAEVVNDRGDERLAQTVRLTTVSSETDDETADASDETAEPDDGAEDESGDAGAAAEDESGDAGAAAEAAVDSVAEMETDRAAMGVDVDVAATADTAWAQGRRGLWRALADQLRVRFGGTLDVPLDLEVDDDHLDDWAAGAADELSVDRRDGAIELSSDDDGTVDIEVVEARPGTSVEPARLQDRVREVALDEPGPVHVRVPADHEPPAITDEDVDATLPDVERAVSAPVELIHPSAAGDDVVLEPQDLAAVLEVAGDPDAPAGQRLQVTSAAQTLADHLGDERLEAISPEPVDAQLTLADGEVSVEEGAAGFEVDLDELAEVVVELAGRESDRSGELPGATTDPGVTTEDAEAVADDAEVLVSAPVVLTNPSAGDDLELSPGQLSQILSVGIEVEDGEPSLEVSASGSALTELLGDDGVAALEEPPVELEVALVDGELSVEGGTPGFELDAEAAADRAAELARASDPDERRGELSGDTDAHDGLTRDELEELGVTEVVSSFTTELVPGQHRNTNIHLAADYIHGDLIEPGETYSLNQGIGERTQARGFVENGFIEEGELTNVVGGGVSQMGTTFMNAAWFAGVALQEFHPHSLYFSRYPMGREATLAWGVLDVVIENDSPHAIMVLTSYSSSSVTVAFASTDWAQVDSWTGEPYDVVPGEERDGFSIDFGREITYPDGSTHAESHSHTYQPQDEPEPEDG